MYHHKCLFLSFFTCWYQFMGIPSNALSIRAVYWGKMSQNIGNVHILWTLIWFNELRLKANGWIIYSTIYFPNEIVMHYVADCIAQKHIFHVSDWKNKSWAVRKPLPSHQERCPAPRNRYAASHWGEPHDGCSCNHRQHGRGRRWAHFNISVGVP